MLSKQMENGKQIQKNKQMKKIFIFTGLLLIGMIMSYLIDNKLFDNENKNLLQPDIVPTFKTGDIISIA